MKMANSFFSFLLLFLFVSTCAQSKPQKHISSPYLSITLFPNYQNMLEKFKIYVYKSPNDNVFNSPPESVFYSQLLNSSFITQNPNEAHLYFVPFAAGTSTRSISRLIRDLRKDLPYWNRALGADHFYVSCDGFEVKSDRNLLELKKNSVQISCFPTPYGKFIPHKDITYPPTSTSALTRSHAPGNRTTRWLGYFRHNGQESNLVKELTSDPEFLIESEPSDYVERMKSSKFCLFVYSGDVSGISEALRFGCVPVVITDRPIQDLPFMDVLMWTEIAVFVGAGGGVKELKHVLVSTWDERGEKMRELGEAAGQHFVWNESPEPYDAFYTLMYQLWSRRHAIRYSRREWM